MARRVQIDRGVSTLVQLDIFVGIGQLFMLLSFDAVLASLVTSEEKPNSEKHLEAYYTGRLCRARIRSERSPLVRPPEQLAGCLDARGSGIDGMMRQ